MVTKRACHIAVCMFPISVVSACLIKSHPTMLGCELSSKMVTSTPSIEAHLNCFQTAWHLHLSPQGKLLGFRGPLCVNGHRYAQLHGGICCKMANSVALHFAIVKRWQTILWLSLASWTAFGLMHNP